MCPLSGQWKHPGRERVRPAAILVGVAGRTAARVLATNFEPLSPRRNSDDRGLLILDHDSAVTYITANTYTLAMTTIPATEARQRWAQTIDAAHRAPVTITEHGRDSVMVIDVTVARRALEALEDAEDAASAAEIHAAVLSGAEPTIPLEEVARELGLTL